MVATRRRTSEPLTSAVTDPRSPFVPTIAYSVIATLSEVSSVRITFETSVCEPFAIFTRNSAER